MPHYKAPNNSLHFLEDVSFEYLLPSGSIQCTQQEEQAIELEQQMALEQAQKDMAELAAQTQQVQPITGAVA